MSFTRSVVCFWRPAMTCQRRSTWLVATAMKAIWRMHAGVQRLMSLITRRTRHQGRHPSPDSLAVSATMRHHGFILSRKPQLPLGHLLAVARNALRMPQREFGPALGVSHRTASRWDTGRSAPSEPQLRRLAALLVPVDRSLAEEAAAHAHETLEDLGLVPPPPPAAPPPPPARPPVTTRDLVDAVVCAGAEASDASPRALRPVLHVAFQRAHELGLSVDEVAKALAPAESAISRSARASSTRRTPQPT